MAKRIRICPKCDYHNEEFETFCIKCATSLMNIAVVSEQEVTNQVTGAPSQDRQFTVSTPIDDRNVVTEKEPPTRRLDMAACLECLSAPGFKFTVQPNVTIGRQGIINIKPVPNSDYISRIHAIFLFENGLWLLRDENSTSGTFVNGIKLIPNIKQPIKNGDQITFANTTFIFRS